VKQPDLYIVLDVDWEHFKERVMNRGRIQEIENFDKNKDYFYNLLKDYTTKVVAQCAVYNIPYVIINTNNLTEDEVFHVTLKAIKEHKLVSFNYEHQI